MTFRNALILVVLQYCLISCTKDIGNVNYGEYPHGVGKVMINKCAVSGCHNKESYMAAGKLDLSSWRSMFSGASSGSPVIPYNSNFSSLCYAINTYPDLGTQTKPTMPLNRSVLSHEEVSTIKNWIDGGAPDNKGNVMWADNPSRKKLYAVNQGCDVVTVFDSETKLPIRYITVGTKSGPDTPHQVKVSPDGKYWYVVFINNNIMQQFSCADDKHIRDIPLTPMAAGTGTENDLDWNTFVITKDSKKAFVVSWTQSGRVAAVDLEKGKLLHYSVALYYPHGITLNKNDSLIYVTAQTGNFIMELDTILSFSNQLPIDGSQIIKYTSSIDPHDIILEAGGDSLLITCQTSSTVAVFNLSSKTTETMIPTGGYPQEIVFSKLTDEYFVSCMEDITSFPNAHGTITKIKFDGSQPKRIACGFQPHGIAVDESKGILYVLSRNVSSNGPAPHHTSQCNGRNGFVNFIDISTFEVLPQRYELSVDPYFIYARP